MPPEAFMFFTPKLCRHDDDTSISFLSAFMQALSLGARRRAFLGISAN